MPQLCVPGNRGAEETVPRFADETSTAALRDE